MLVLTRKKGEQLQIGENINISILSINGNQVKIGIDAPKEISIKRKEVILQKEKDDIDTKKDPEAPKALEQTTSSNNLEEENKDI